MRKAGCFFRSIVPFLAAAALQLAVSIPFHIIYTFRHAQNGGLSGFMSALDAASADTSLIQTVNLVYGILALIIFVFWYRRVFVLPLRRKRQGNQTDSRPRGFSFHNVLALFFLAVSLQYVITFVVDAAAALHPAWLTAYNELMESTGYSSASASLILYSGFLAPIVEETVFRGLIFRYARCALPFWLANIWQALLFGVLHMNMLQGIYAFTAGLIFGFICHRGRGIRYSILLHMLFNLISMFYSGLFDLTTALNYPLFIGIGFVLTIFALWLFYTDFSKQKYRE